MNQESRRYARSLTDLEIALRNDQGQLIDERAKAHEISQGGFRLESKAPLAEGTRLTFTMDLGDGDLVRGAVKIVWARIDEWGGHQAGAKIVRISWKDARKLRGQNAPAGYDFAALAKKALLACYWLIIIVGARSIIVDQPNVQEALGRSLPALGAAVVIGFALMWLFD